MPPPHSPFQKLPIELQLTILEEVLVSQKPIVVGESSLTNRYPRPDFLANWGSREACVKFFELAETLPVDPCHDMDQHLALHYDTLNEMFRLYYDDAPLRQRYGSRSPEDFNRQVWNFLGRLKTHPRIVMSRNEVTTGLFRVDRRTSALALRTFYRKNQFVFPLGFVFLEAWTHTIGLNRNFLTSLQIDLGGFPRPADGLERQVIDSNILGWIMDMESERLGLLPREARNPCADNRLLGSLETFREYFMGPQTSLTELHLQGDLYQLIRISRKLCATRDKVESTHENDAISRILNFDNKKPKFKISFTAKSWTGLTTVDYHTVHDIAARKVEKLGWGTMTVEYLGKLGGPR